jgi:co-chaperonin GroES (HSP10)
MSKLRTIGKWIEVQTVGEGEKKTTEGIIYTEKAKSKMFWSRVISLGDKITEDIKVGDRVMWDISKIQGQGYGKNNIVHQDWISLVERNQ